MRWSKALLGLLFLVAACVNRSPLPNVEAASSVHFKSGIDACTAISIGGGSVLTAGHCIFRFAATVEEFPAKIQWLNTTLDVALLQVPGLESAPFSELTCREPQIGEDVMVIADTRWRKDIYVFGKVASKTFTHGTGRIMNLFDIRGAPGNSGAPIYDTKGRVLAMVVAVVSTQGDMIAAVPGSILCALLEGEGKITPPPSPS